MSGSSETAIRSSLETTRHRDTKAIHRRLAQWLTRNGGGEVAQISAPTSSGASSELFFVDLRDSAIAGRGLHSLVLRLIGEHAIYPHVDPQMQFTAQTLLAERSLAPVPRPLAFEPDPAAMGAAFILMERSEGRGAPDFPSYVKEGWIHDLANDERQTLWRNAIAAIAAVHATDLSGCDLATLDLPTAGDKPIDRLVAYWRLYRNVVGAHGSYPAIDQAVAWLEREKPIINVGPRMLWGDASLRNMLFCGLKPAALLDLEFAHVGIPHFDIAFFATMDRVMAEAYAGVPRLPGFWDEARTFDEYERLTGLSIGSRDYFCRMAVTYMALANTRVFQRLAAEGRIATAEVGRNPPLRFLAKMFDLAEPGH